MDAAAHTSAIASRIALVGFVTVSLLRSIIVFTVSIYCYRVCSKRYVMNQQKHHLLKPATLNCIYL